MKKIFFAILGFGLSLASCDMDQDPAGEITDNESIQTASDVEGYRNGVYSSFRALTSGDYVTCTELEMDKFLGTLDNGHRGQTFSNAQVNASTSEIDDNYAGCYSVMKNINFAIPHAQALIDGGALEDDEIVAVSRYIGELKFFRAYIYYWLYDHYCQAYDEARADEPGLGLQLVTEYHPTGDTGSYPGRSSMNESFEQIESDLNDAFDAMVEFEKTDKTNCAPNASYLSSYAVAALQSRVALLKKDYTTCISKANYVVTSGLFPLTTGDDYAEMWATDAGSELIFVPFVDSSESAYVGSYFDAWNYGVTYPTRVDYLPTYAALTAYDDEDIRFDSFFAIIRRMTFGEYTVSTYTFQKFPGNTDLNVGTANSFKNKPKPFRSSELYLNVAEAAAATNDASTANKALNDLIRARRFSPEEYSDVTYSGQNLVNAIRDERSKELIGEGFRMSDLRRWNLGFTRDGSFPILPVIEDIYLSSNVNVQFTPGDYRYVWPIPQHQMEINPQLKGQQNPGYSN